MLTCLLKLCIVSAVSLCLTAVHECGVQFGAFVFCCCYAEN